MSGAALLDFSLLTFRRVNHILDFSKISNLTKSQRKEQDDADSERKRIAGNNESTGPQEHLSVDLARLTEEFVAHILSYSDAKALTILAGSSRPSSPATDIMSSQGKGHYHVT